MELLFNLILITSIWVLGLTIATQEDMIFHNLRVNAERHKDNGWGIMDAVILCHWCMPSIHSVFGYAIAYGIITIPEITWVHLAMYPPVVMGSSILCGLIWSLYKLISAITQYYEDLNNIPYSEDIINSEN
jgi:hypothetical protein